MTICSEIIGSDSKDIYFKHFNDKVYNRLRVIVITGSPQGESTEKMRDKKKESKKLMNIAHKLNKANTTNAHSLCGWW